MVGKDHNIEIMSDKEEDMRKELNAKYRRIQRQTAAFWNDVDVRREEVLQHLQVAPQGDLSEDQILQLADQYKSEIVEHWNFLPALEAYDRLQKLADNYGTDVPGLLQYFGSASQTAKYRETHD